MCRILGIHSQCARVYVNACVCMGPWYHTNTQINAKIFISFRFTRAFVAHSSSALFLLYVCLVLFSLSLSSFICWFGRFGWFFFFFSSYSGGFAYCLCGYFVWVFVCLFFFCFLSLSHSAETTAMATAAVVVCIWWDSSSMPLSIKFSSLA